MCWGDEIGGGMSGGAPAGPLRAVSVGSLYACAVKADKSVACWGDDEYRRARPPSGLVVL